MILEKSRCPNCHVDVGDSALDRLSDILIGLGISEKVLMVADVNTWKAAGKQAEDVLERGGFDSIRLIFDRGHQLRPDEEAVERIFAFTKENQGILLAVGSGTITDLVRHAASILGRQYISVATAPSMDGYASVISALTVNGVKKTFYGNAPLAIIADTSVLAKAPRKMVMAGYGDILAKLVSIADWKLGVALMDEQWCVDAALMSIKARDKVLQSTHSISQSETQGIHDLSEALINSGMAIITAGQTRPASGAEHHFAHYLEMKLAMEKRAEILHGIKVGLGTLCSIAFYNALAEFDPGSIDPVNLSCKLAEKKNWMEKMRLAFGSIADDVIGESDLAYRDRQILLARLQKIKDKWFADIKPIIDDVPKLHEVLALIESAGFDYTPASLGLTIEEMNTALMYAMEVRPRYTILRLMDDLGLLENYAAQVATDMFKKPEERIF